jgi:hypothetical protein
MANSTRSPSPDTANQGLQGQAQLNAGGVLDPQVQTLVDALSAALCPVIPAAVAPAAAPVTGRNPVSVNVQYGRFCAV